MIIRIIRLLRFLRQEKVRAFIHHTPSMPAFILRFNSAALCCIAILTLGSCSTMRHWFGREASRNPAHEPTAPDAAAPVVDASAAGSPAIPDDGFRLPDLLAMPTESEFKATVATPPPPGSGTVTARPPATSAETPETSTTPFQPEEAPPAGR